jgi:hypothetical protein
MNIKEVPGNIVDCPEGVNCIIHQANINRRMGAGVALALCDKWPIIRETDQKHNPTQQCNELGDFSACQVEPDPIFVFNLYAQSILFDSLAGCRTDYSAAVGGLAKIRNLLVTWESRGFTPVVGVPRLMGCGLAGGNWEIYSKIITETFKNTSFDLVIVDFGK